MLVAPVSEGRPLTPRVRRSRPFRGKSTHGVIVIVRAIDVSSGPYEDAVRSRDTSSPHKATGVPSRSKTCTGTGAAAQEDIDAIVRITRHSDCFSRAACRPGIWPSSRPRDTGAELNRRSGAGRG